VCQPSAFARSAKAQRLRRASSRVTGSSYRRTASESGGPEYNFALGTDHDWLTHSGDVPGYTTQVAYLPKKKKATIIVFTNTDIPNPSGGSPAPALFSALAKVVSPGNVPTGTG
jgi:hypothetical protein